MRHELRADGGRTRQRAHEQTIPLAALVAQGLGRKAERNLLPMQPGDVPDTCADVSALARDTGYTPATPIETGVGRFVDWYRDYYGV